MKVQQPIASGLFSPSLFRIVTLHHKTCWVSHPPSISVETLDLNHPKLALSPPIGKYMLVLALTTHCGESLSLSLYRTPDL
ncbi:hypothetical protein L1887_13063 [Cichorium endivia]|nr:hypothetical protein L1887_13063 [Cichorium endivia]